MAQYSASMQIFFTSEFLAIIKTGSEIGAVIIIHDTYVSSLQ